MPFHDVQLAPSTRYFYRCVAVGVGGETDGASSWISTLPDAAQAFYRDVGLNPATRYCYRWWAEGESGRTFGGSSCAVTGSIGGEVGSTLGGGHVYYDRDTRELVNDKTGTRRKAPGVLWLKYKNTRRDFKTLAGKLYRDFPKRRIHH